MVFVGMIQTSRRAASPARAFWFACVATAFIASVPQAAELAVPILEEGGDGQAANCASSVVGGLPRGRDGFLAVRSGPGADYAKLAELKNGETVIVFQTRGEWAGIVYRTQNVTCSSKSTRPIAYDRKGWVNTKWLKPLAG